MVDLLHVKHLFLSIYFIKSFNFNRNLIASDNNTLSAIDNDANCACKAKSALLLFNLNYWIHQKKNFIDYLAQKVILFGWWKFISHMFNLFITNKTFLNSIYKKRYFIE